MHNVSYPKYKHKLVEQLLGLDGIEYTKKELEAMNKETLYGIRIRMLYGRKEVNYGSQI